MVCPGGFDEVHSHLKVRIWQDGGQTRRARLNLPPRVSSKLQRSSVDGKRTPVSDGEVYRVCDGSEIAQVKIMLDDDRWIRNAVPGVRIDHGDDRRERTRL